MNDTRARLAAHVAQIRLARAGQFIGWAGGLYGGLTGGGLSALALGGLVAAVFRVARPAPTAEFDRYTGRRPDPD